MKNLKTKLTISTLGLILIVGFQNCGGAQQSQLGGSNLSSTENDNGSKLSFSNNEFSSLSIGQSCNLSAYRNLPQENHNMALSENVDLVIRRNKWHVLTGEDDRSLEAYQALSSQELERHLQQGTLPNSIRRHQLEADEVACVISKETLKADVLSGSVPLLDLINEQCPGLVVSKIEDDIDSASEQGIFDLIKNERTFSEQDLQPYTLYASSTTYQNANFMGFLMGIDKRSNGTLVPSTYEGVINYEKKFGFMGVVRHNSGTDTDRCDYDNRGE